MMRNGFVALCLAVLLSACNSGSVGPGPISGGPGGGGGGGGGGGTTASNAVTVTVDAGPAALNTGANAYTATNVLYVSITLCAPGSTTNCQTIDHIQVDTGSVGLRLLPSVLNASLLSAMPLETDTSGNPVGECYAYVDGYVFGSVRQADFQISGKTVSDMPVQVIADSGQFSTAPSSCSSGGGTFLNTVQLFGANGIIGIGVTATDCGSVCASGGASSAIYYDCPTSGCVSIIARNANSVAPFQQLPNPVAAFSGDNNGTLISLPAVPTGGEATLTGTLYFGIGTEGNNALPTTASILTTTNSQNVLGAGLLTTLYNGQSLNESFIDSGSSEYFFVDNAIATCAESGFAGQYCPTSPLTIGTTIMGQNGTSASDTFTLYNAQTAFVAGYAVVPGVGGDPNIIDGLAPYPNSFDFGLPFFYGRNVYTAIEGESAAGVNGPYIAF
jgi:hypothetical protein